MILINLSDFYNKTRDKRIAVLGIGVSNIPLIRMLSNYCAEITARDRKTRAELGDVLCARLESEGVTLRLGENYLDNLEADLIFRSPSLRPDLPELAAASEIGTEITSEIEVFMDICPAPIIAVTGSDGKSTTSTLIYEILKAAGKTCWLGGNIGTPLLDRVEEIKPDNSVVLELSSFQLMTMQRSPQTAVITNISPNHLDIHKSMEEYITAKKQIYLHQKTGDRLILNADNAVTRNICPERKDNVEFFSRLDINADAVYSDGIIYYKNSPVIQRDSLLLPGNHNAENFMAAICATWGIGIDRTVYKKVAESFRGVPHRGEFVTECRGVRYYNDSIGSSPTRAAATLQSFEHKKGRIILIAGGSDKQIPFEPLAPVVHEYCKALVLIGATAGKIRAAIEETEKTEKKGKIPIYDCISLEQAVEQASILASEGDIVLLSPACASFDMFKNFEERGELFRKYALNM